MSIPGKLDTIVLDNIVIEPEMGLDHRTKDPVIFVRVYDTAKNEMITAAVCRNEQEYREFVEAILPGQN